MKIQSVEVIPLAASFTTTFRFGTTDHSASTNVVLIIRSDAGPVGYGEACPVPAFTSETQHSIVELVEQRVAPVLLGRDPSDRLPLLRDTGWVLKFAPFTAAAVDAALLDLVGRAVGLLVHSLLGGCFRTSIEAHGFVDWDHDPSAIGDVAVRQAAKHRWLKLYAGRGELDADLDRLQAVRDAVGPDIQLFVHINAMWTPPDLVRALPRVKKIGLRMLEQPLPPAGAAFQRDLVAGLEIDVAADEAVRTGYLLAAIWSPVDGHRQPSKGTRHFVERAVDAGAHVRYGVKVTGLDEHNTRIAGVTTSARPNPRRSAPGQYRSATPDQDHPWLRRGQRQPLLGRTGRYDTGRTSRRRRLCRAGWPHGHHWPSGHGLALGPVLREIAADLAIEGRTHRPIDAFALDRFRRGQVAQPAMTI